jgi:sulfite reductase (NADPH) hemoprotein beta-component
LTACSSINEAAENKNFVDPLYGKTYLPRKFKIAFVIPPVNDMDIFTNCLGFIAIVENDQLIGYNLCGRRRHGPQPWQRPTYPRLADVIGFFTPDKVVDVAKAVLTIHRDFGDRTDRKHARLKYVVAERGVKFMQDEVNRAPASRSRPAKPYKFTTTADLLGWRKAVDGKWFLGLFVETGRVKGESKKKPLARSRGQISANRIPPDRESKCHSRQRFGRRQNRHQRVLAAHGVKTENQASVLHAAAWRVRRCRPAASASRNPNACCPA